MADLSPKERELLALVASEPCLDQEDDRLSSFCDDGPTRNDTDTFNRMCDEGYLRTTHDNRTDCGTVYITDKGRAALSPTEGQ